MNTPAERYEALTAAGSADERPGATPFVGREQQLTALSAALGQARDERTCRLVTVTGAPGIGKSRLVREFTATLGEEATVVVGRCLSYGEGITYRPLAEIVRQLGPDPATRLAELLEGDAQAEPVTRAVLGTVGLAETAGSSDDTFWAFRRLFEALARERAFVAVFEDLHWAEPRLLDLLDSVTAFSSGAPIVLLCLARPELLERRPEWAVPGPDRIGFPLEPLSEDEARAMMVTLEPELDEEAFEQIVERADGNPLFLEQLVAAVRDGAEPKLPATVQALLAARIGQLAPAERSLLERASVEGRTFHRGAVENLLRKAERAQIGSVLMALVRKQFISPSQPEFAGEDAFRFTHVLIREAAYESLPKQVRAELHEQIAAWLDQKPQSEDEIVGYHLEQAIGRRLRDVRRRSLAREREEEREPEVIELGPGGDAPESIGGLVVPFEPELEQMRRGLVLALRDYVGKNGFGDVVLGLSGGIDSALVAALAVDALGPEHVHCVSMPSRYSSEGTRSDARRLAENLGCDFREIAIEDIVTAFHAALGGLDGLAAENVQARIRGTMLMALSNTHGWLVLATGNKSELSVGYSTLYGDLAGGFALIKDVYKTDVFRLVLHLNERADRELVPASIIERAPSAELRDEQLDSDSLPPYPELDPVLEAYVELDRSRDELVAEGFDAGVVDRALALIDRAEYKRRQAPPGVKLRPKAFGRDRRTPITNRWQG